MSGATVFAFGEAMARTLESVLLKVSDADVTWCSQRAAELEAQWRDSDDLYSCSCSECSCADGSCECSDGDSEGSAVLDAATQYDVEDLPQQLLSRTRARSQFTQTQAEEKDDGAGVAGDRSLAPVAWTVELPSTRPKPSLRNRSKSPPTVPSLAPPRLQPLAQFKPRPLRSAAPSPAATAPNEPYTGRYAGYDIPNLRPYLNPRSASTPQIAPSPGPVLTPDNMCQHCWKHHGVKHLKSDHGKPSRLRQELK